MDLFQKHKMSYLSDFQRGQIIAARQAGVSITETTQLLGVPRSTQSKAMAACPQRSKTSLAKKNNKRKDKLSERHGSVL